MVTEQEVRDWLSNPVTLAHKAKLSDMAREATDMRGQGIIDRPTAEEMGLMTIACINRASGLEEAYGQDPDMFYGWLVGGDA
jgi:hypothetical protein